ncbi:hypothetical protein B0H12DRAFT_1243566 [Mycena haematopus]|nr:hypothetical protein B0H12DRAFT_1243566 [Mycena haematopus]
MSGSYARLGPPDRKYKDFCKALLKESIPPDIQSQAAAILPPRQPTEDQADFDKRAAVKLKSKERKHLAFPLPTPPQPVVPSAAPRPATKLDALHKSARFGQLPSIEEYTSVGSASKTGTAQQMRHARHWCGASHIAHMTANSQCPPVNMNNSNSAYATGTDESGRDLLSEFTDNAADSLRITIDNKLGSRIDLPPNVRTPKVAEPVKYSGEDDHDFFTIVFLEKLLAWMRTGNYGGFDLDAYRVVLLQSYLDGEAHRWYVNEINEYSGENGGESPEFAEVICVLHRRFVKSSTAQRATRAFDSVKWDAASGPEQLYTDLIEKGRLMVEAPSSLTLRHRFMGLMPRWITKQMKLNRGLTAEFSTIEILCTHARQIWEVDTAIKEEENTLMDTPRPMADTLDDDRRSPDLGELLESNDDEDGVRLSAMNFTPRYYSMRTISTDTEISEDEDLTEGNTEDSVTTVSDLSSATVDDDNHSRHRLNDPLGPFGYNPGPISTPENGLIMDCEYTVCEHLANIGLSASHREVTPMKDSKTCLSIAKESPTSK